ncbi:MAG: FAD-binding domain-containing protein [Pseudomonadota bacterium]
MTGSTLQIVWIKRDFRVTDHAPLAAASERGPVAVVYIVEPGYWALPETSHRHLDLFRDAADDLQNALHRLNGSLHVFKGDVLDVFQRIRDEAGDIAIHSHQETGNAWTFKRDQRVGDWCQTHGIEWTEYPTFGVWRGAKLNRDRWAADWDRFMTKPVIAVPDRVEFASLKSDRMNFAFDLAMAEDAIQDRQKTSRALALSTLETFLAERGEHYRTDMSSPILGTNGCSRLSAHFVAGTLSMREAFQRTLDQIECFGALEPAKRKYWSGSLKSFTGRLHWHCHFIQKLEAEPEIEWRPMARAYEGLRESNPGTLDIYEAGQTGFPFVDACLRSLKATGWINFRMRAMLTSFACYDLFLPWQDSGRVLARWFTDYEPGIHWSQSQMQAGETGINTLRIYSPVKQGLDQDPNGDFTRRWVPELAHLDGKTVHEPWKHGGVSGYPDPIVDHKEAAKLARDRIWAVRRTPEAQREADAVQEKHGSRRRRGRRPQPRKKVAEQPQTLDLFEA